MHDHTPFLSLQITSPDIKPHVKWAVSLVIANGHLKEDGVHSNEWVIVVLFFNRTVN